MNGREGLTTGRDHAAGPGNGWLDGLFRDCRRSLKAYVQRIVASSDVAEDLVQEAFLRIYALPQPELVRSPRGLLFRTARNLAINHWRRDCMVVSLYDDSRNVDHAPDDRPSASDTLAARQELGLLLRAIDSLPTRCREIFVLKRVHGWSYREIAAHMAISEKTVEVQVAKGARLCHEFLTRQGTSGPRGGNA